MFTTFAVFTLLYISSSEWCCDGFKRDGGIPKFPHHLCNIRSVNWTPHRSPKIIGGQEPPLGAIPWVVDLLKRGKHHCGGVLISKRLVLTVAHCYLDDLTIRAGAHTSIVTPTEQNVKVKKWISHPQFRDFGPYSNDIALLYLESPIRETPYVKPACISNQSPPPGTICEVSGWGAFDAKKKDVISPVLQTAVVPLLSLEVCRQDKVLGGRQQAILDTMVCAGKLRGGVDACGGDSGGPLMCHYDSRLILTGLVSWGDGCAKKHRPGVYTRVASYKEWIYDTALNLGEEI